MFPEYREHGLPPPLSELVECVWFLKSPRRPPGAPPERIFPDGCVEMIVQLSGRARSAEPGRPFALQPAAFVLAPAAGPLLLDPLGGMETVGVRFRPGAAAAFLPGGVDRLGGAAVPLDAAFGREGAELADRLLEASSRRACVDIVRAFLERRLDAARRTESAGLVAAAVRRMLRAPAVSVSDLARECGWSVRQLERRFLAEAGLTPRLLGRVIRFQRVFHAMADERSDWVSVALACGYADQPHLVRDFREFTGLTPGAFRRDGAGLANAFVTASRLERFFAV